MLPGELRGYGDVCRSITWITSPLGRKYISTYIIFGSVHENAYGIKKII